MSLIVKTKRRKELIIVRNRLQTIDNKLSSYYYSVTDNKFDYFVFI